MDTQGLQAFIQVAELGSFSKAAEKLFLTQPAVSKRIALLEQQLNCALFDRIGRSNKLTEAGNALYPKAQQILRDIYAAERSIKELKGSVAGTLSIGISHHIGLHRLPPVLQAFSKRYPKVHLDIDFLDSEEAHQAVMQGDRELAVVTLDPKQRQLKHKTIWIDTLAIVVAKDFVGENTINSLAELSRHNAILPGLNTYTGQIIAELFQRQKLSLNITMATNYLETIKMMVEIGLGWSVLPLTMIDDKLTQIKLTELTIQRELGYIYHPNHSLSNAGQAFLTALDQHIDTNTLNNT